MRIRYWSSDVCSSDLPLRVGETLVLQAPLILHHAGVTVAEVLLGIALGSLLGALTALQLMMSRTMMRLVLPVLVFSQAVPVFALAPLLKIGRASCGGRGCTTV